MSKIYRRALLCGQANECAHLEQLQAEIDRLREALRGVATAYDKSDARIETGDDAAVAMYCIAVDALEGGEE